MTLLYLDIKNTPLHTASIPLVPAFDSIGYALVDPNTGDFVIRLPPEIRQLPVSGVVYEDDWISIRL